MRLHDTIAAPATPPAAAARAIVRTSGPAAFELLASVAAGDASSHASATQRRATLADGIVVPATVYAFRGPRSSTGDDVVEYHLPGSPLFVRLLLARLIERGARMAEPGEFTARAFFAGRLDLARAEGVALAIAAADRRQLDAARQLLAGELSRRVAPIADALANALASVEATLDFSDEPVDAVEADAIRASVEKIDASLAAIVADTARIGPLAHEPRVVLTGRPNAGKSTLFNALAGIDRAVVSDVAGTTRDALSARVALRRGSVTLVDTAGAGEFDDRDAIGRQMHGVAADERERADVVVHVVAADDPAEPEGRFDLVVLTKRDRADQVGGDLAVCAPTGEGVDALRARLDAIAFGVQSDRPTIAINARHAAAITSARDDLAVALAASAAGPEFVAAAVRRALDAIGSIAGTTSPDDVLGRIFGSFCIGK